MECFGRFFDQSGAPEGVWDGKFEIKNGSAKNIEKWMAGAGHGGGVGWARLREGSLKTPVPDYSVWVSKQQHHWVMGWIPMPAANTATALWTQDCNPRSNTNIEEICNI